jgi:hypothetical protein
MSRPGSTGNKRFRLYGVNWRRGSELLITTILPVPHLVVVHDADASKILSQSFDLLSPPVDVFFQCAKIGFTD